MSQDKPVLVDSLKEYIQPDGGLYCLGHYLSWSPGDKEITLDDSFDIDELEAIVRYIRAMLAAAPHASGPASGSPDAKISSE